MQISDDDVAELKIWIVQKLENISDADSDVLADYVLALIRVETPESKLRQDATEALEDFLKNDTAGFVDEVFHAVRDGSYKTNYVAPQIASNSIPPLATPTGPVGAYDNLTSGQNLPGAQQSSRKRSFTAANEPNGRGDAHYGRGDRHIKQLRRGGRNTRGGRGNFQNTGSSYPYAGSPPAPPNFSQMSDMPQLPLPQNLQFDLNDPIAVMMAMQPLMQPPPGISPLPRPSSSGNFNRQFGERRDRCRDYDLQGFCTRGDSCPYEHGTDRLVAPGQDEYDPKNSLMDAQPTPPVTNGHGQSSEQRMNGSIRGRGRGDRGGFTPRRQNNRAEFSQAGPNHDRSITTIVVEQIPEEKFDEESVREFFSDFGNIVEISMRPYKRLAIVKYDEYNAARRAYDSPKVIFGNRFVKVYWYKPDTLPTPPSSAKPATNGTAHVNEEQPFDKEEFERNSMAAQKKLEEKKVQMKEMEERRQALEKQKEELALKQSEEKRKLLEKLAAKGVTSNDTAMPDTATNGTNGTPDDPKVSAHTMALRKKVAELEAEAKSLGLDSSLSDYTPRGRGRGRGRGSYRGWEGFAAPFRGNPRGRGGFRGRVASSGYNLDLRTKKVAVSGVDFDTAKDEALRQYLISVGEYQSIEPHPDHPDSQLVTFKDRPTAEAFMYGNKDIPNVGKVEFSWYNAPSSAPSNVNAKRADADGNIGTGDADADTGGGNKGQQVEDYDIAEDYDVADDVVS
ncbi:hypothetical protein ACLMJK_001840 [Lecanora helva]